MMSHIARYEFLQGRILLDMSLIKQEWCKKATTYVIIIIEMLKEILTC
jgi:hypothetical protein